jgi:hypothetical protein
MNHFVKVLIYACFAAVATLLLGAGAHLNGSLLMAVPLAAAVGFVTLVAGVASLIATRQIFKLSQSGRVIEISAFWLIGSLVFKVLGALAPAWLTVTSPLLAGAVLVLSVVVLAFVTGNIAMFGRRALLPQRMKSE